MTRTLIVISMLSLGCVAASAPPKISKCLLEVKQKTYLKGPCDVTMNDHYGSFAIGVGEKRRSKYFAYVNMEDDGAHGYWNETPDASHADSELGILHREGACWVNATARVCAFK